MPQFSKVLIVLSLVLMPVVASALEFKSVSVPKAVLYDAPSSSAKKILLLSQYYPVEIIVNLGDWLKVRDAEGSISWVETKQLSDKRTVMITISQAEVRQATDAGASLVATLEKGVLLEVVDTKPNNGWLKVRHRDGATGFVLISSTWGFN
ncbi:MAG: SH3 domain-containing protein [Methylotenera sp.]|nr:SH3 domain-containing protein [Methylotenera sp.]